MRKIEAVSNKLRAYYKLTKPGIIQGNLLMCFAGFMLAANGHLPVGRLLATLFGTALIIGAACVVNNCLDRGIDAKMVRTSQRATATGAISLRAAGLYALIMGALGLYLLLSFVNLRTALVGVGGLLAYTVLYSYAKRRSSHGTLVGTISGATPPVAGYVAITNRFDSTALLLFVVMVCWQMPHFYGIALYRQKDYQAAGIPVLPIVKGAYRTKLEIMIYSGLFIVSCLLLSTVGRASYLFAASMLVLGVSWLQRGWHGFNSQNNSAWGRSMFLFSLIVLLAMAVILSLNAWLP